MGVALRKESVDRNLLIQSFCHASHVALRKESVDRNHAKGTYGCTCQWSLSARRAWIEIMKEYTQYKVLRVALRKESVDRN